MRILLLAPYSGGSHRAWAEGYASHSRHEVAVAALPARFWKWRMQGGAVTLAERVRARRTQPDLILASEMLNLPAFLALTRDLHAGVPSALYCHENQLTYPLPEGEKRDLTYAMINWLSMLAADWVFFNSRHHLEDWFTALPNMLKHFPDHTHLHRIAGVREKASVLPVGVDLRRLGDVPQRKSSDADPVILWNQRWEYDKKPQTFFRALYRLAEEGVEFRVVISGHRRRQAAPEFEEARDRLGARVIHFGYAEEPKYASLLHRSDVVVSTAIHEFFGVAVVEAIYSGCFPVLPDRLSYPELIPETHRDACLYGDFEGLLDRLRWALRNRDTARRMTDHLRMSVARFDWSVLGPVYDRSLTELRRASSWRRRTSDTHADGSSPAARE